MATLNKSARDIMVKYNVHSCTDVTGFSLLGHSYEMAQGSECTINLYTSKIPYHKEAYEFADMGFIPAGAYRNREYAEAGVKVIGNIERPLMDICFDPQTSGGLLISIDGKDADNAVKEMKAAGLNAEIIGSVSEKKDFPIYLYEE